MNTSEIKEKFLNCAETDQYLEIVLNAEATGEKHHILPKSIWPEFEHLKWNIVVLSRLNHLKAHELLPMMLEGMARRKMAFAWKMMSNRLYSPPVQELEAVVSQAHKNRASEYWTDDNKEKHRKLAIARWALEHERIKQSVRMKEVWTDETYRAEMLKLFSSDDYRKAHAESVNTENYKEMQSLMSKERWTDEEFRDKMSEIRRVIWGRSEYRANQIKSATERWENEEYRQRVSDGVRLYWSDDENKKKFSDAMKLSWASLTDADRAERSKALSEGFTPERRATISARMRENPPMRNPEVAKKVALANIGRKCTDTCKSQTSKANSRPLEYNGAIYKSGVELARHLGVTPTSVCRLVKQGKATKLPKE